MKRLLPLLLGAALVAGCGSFGATAVTVNGNRVTQHSLDRELESIRDNEAYRKFVDTNLQARGTGYQVLGSGPGTFTAAFAAQVLTLRVYYELVHEELDRRNIRASDKELGSAKQTLARQIGNGNAAAGSRIFARFDKGYAGDIVRREAEVELLQARVGGGRVTDARLLTYYDQHRAEFPQVCVMHVLLDSQAAAVATRASLARGADFAQVATTQSKDPSAKQNHGDLGCQAPDGYVAEFARAATTLPIGQLSDPVQTQLGWHVLKVYDRRTAPFDQVKDDIGQRLSGSAREAFLTWLSKAVSKARVSVNPKYGRFDKSQDLPSIVPPEAPRPPGGAAPSTTAPAQP